MKRRIVRLLTVLLALSVGLACADTFSLFDFSGETDEVVLTALEEAMTEAESRGLIRTERDTDGSVLLQYLTEAPAERSVSRSTGIKVWIPKSGHKYHCDPHCSNMDDPSEVTEEQAISMGYEPCKRCW